MQSRPPTAASRLQSEQLHLGYDGTPVLAGIDLAIAEGQLTSLIGPNGCGKSTLLRALGRMLAPQSGQVLLDGKAIHRQRSSEVARTLGMLPQSPHTPEGLLVRQLVALGRFPYQRAWRQWSRADERAVTRAMATANVAQFADRPVDRLSGGQRQRCWIAMVLAQETDVLLLDEPTTFLDLKVQVEILELLCDLAHRQGRSLLVVLHDLNLAASYADTIVMMRDGEIAGQGAPAEVITPEHLRQVFDLHARVVRDPETGRPLCVPARPPRSSQAA